MKRKSRWHVNNNNNNKKCSWSAPTAVLGTMWGNKGTRIIITSASCLQWAIAMNFSESHCSRIRSYYYLNFQALNCAHFFHLSRFLPLYLFSFLVLQVTNHSVLLPRINLFLFPLSFLWKKSILIWTAWYICPDVFLIW